LKEKAMGYPKEKHELLFPQTFSKPFLLTKEKATGYPKEKHELLFPQTFWAFKTAVAEGPKKADKRVWTGAMFEAPAKLRGPVRGSAVLSGGRISDKRWIGCFLATGSGWTWSFSH
jgi:hypothetical protein